MNIACRSCGQIVAALYTLGAGEQAEAEVRRSERQVMTVPDDQLCMLLTSIEMRCPSILRLIGRLEHWDAAKTVHSLQQSRTLCNDPHFHNTFEELVISLFSHAQRNGLCMLFTGGVRVPGSSFAVSHDLLPLQHSLVCAPAPLFLRALSLNAHNQERTMHSRRGCTPQQVEAS